MIIIIVDFVIQAENRDKIMEIEKWNIFRPYQRTKKIVEHEGEDNNNHNCLSW